MREALGDALRESKEFKKEINKESAPVVKEVQKTISLSSLKKTEIVQHSHAKIYDKEASSEKVSALQEAINRARNSTVDNDTDKKNTVTNIHIQTNNITNIQTGENPSVISDTKKYDSVSEKEESGVHVPVSKKVREVPEDVLRSVLE